MADLLQSIEAVGIQVPLTVYWDPDEDSFILIDGERRWRCARKLNLANVPVFTQAKPSRLGNILMMFNIHNVRVDWDLLPTALKLRTVKELLAEEGKPLEVRDLAAVTGLRLATVRRLLDLLNLPQQYQDLLLREAEKPRHEQEVTADLFVEIYKSLHAVERHTPEVLQDITSDRYVDAMVNKYRSGVVKNVVHFRDVSKIARAELAGVGKRKAIPIIKRLINDPAMSIDKAYDESVRYAYEERDLLTRIKSLEDRLKEFAQRGELTEELQDTLRSLLNTIQWLLKNL